MQCGMPLVLADYGDKRKNSFVFVTLILEPNSIL